MRTLKNLIFVCSCILLLFSCNEDEKKPNLSNRLQANAGTDRIVPVGIAVELDGSGSKDGNNRPFNFLWTVKSKPDNSNPSLEKGIEAKSYFTPDLAGIYEIELKIANETGVNRTVIKLTAVDGNQAETVILDQDITQNRILTDIHEDPNIPDYVITVNIGVKASLTIQPGVVIAFEEKKGLIVHPEGTLVAKGEPSKIISFVGKSPSKGFWAGVAIRSNHPLNTLEHLEVRDAGSNPIYPIPQSTSIGLSHNAYVNISHTTIHQSFGHGLWLDNTASMDFGNNIFKDNNGINVIIPIQEAHKLDTETMFQAQSETFNFIEVVGSELVIEGIVTWNKLGNNARFRIKDNLVIKSDLILAKGINIGVAPDKFLRIEGSLFAKGTQGDKIVMDVWPLGENNWGGLVFHSNNDQNRLEWVEIRNAGNNQKGYGMDKSAAVGIDNGNEGKLHLVNTKIKGSKSYGLYMEPGAQLGDCKGLTIEDNIGRPIALPANSVQRLNDANLVFSQNQLPSVEVLGFSLQEDQETLWAPLPDGIPYYIPNQLDVLSGLKLLPGVKMEFTQHAMLAVLQDGYLQAQGTTQEKIEFKGSVNQKSYWRGIIFKSSSDLNTMDHTIVSGAGSQALPWSGGRNASIGVFPGGAGLQLKNSKISNGGGWGILVESSFGAYINPDAESANQFEELTQGKIIHL